MHFVVWRLMSTKDVHAKEDVSCDGVVVFVEHARVSDQPQD